MSNYYLKVHMNKRHGKDIPVAAANAEQMNQTIVDSEKKHHEEIEQIKNYFTRELNEMSAKMSEWQRLAEQLRTAQTIAPDKENRDVLMVKSATVESISEKSVTPTTPKQRKIPSLKIEELDSVEQEKRILDQLGSQLNSQFSSFSTQLDERVLKLSRGIAEQVAADSKQHVNSLSEQVSNLMNLLAKEREARGKAERQRDEAIASSQQQLQQKQQYIQQQQQQQQYQQQPAPYQHHPKQTLFNKHRAESQSTPALAVPQQQIIQTQTSHPQIVAKTPEKKKSFFSALSSKFKSPKKAQSMSSLQQQQNVKPRQAVVEEPSRPVEQFATLPRSKAVEQTSTVQLLQQSEQKSQQPFLVALMEGTSKESESELTSRPSSSSPAPFKQWQPVESKSAVQQPQLLKEESPKILKNAQPTPSSTLQASVTLPTMESSKLGDVTQTSMPGDGAYLQATNTTSGTVTGLQLRARTPDESSRSVTVRTEVAEGVRKQMEDKLDAILQEKGIKKHETRLNEEQYQRLRIQLENERRQREFTHPDFFSFTDTRTRISNLIDKMAIEDYNAGGYTYRSDRSGEISVSELAPQKSGPRIALKSETP